MPVDPSPGPSGPNCIALLESDPGGPQSIEIEAAGTSQPGEIAFTMRSQTLVGDDADRAGLDGEPVGAGPGSLPLSDVPDPSGATTDGPHLHERWNEARKLELSYCINSVGADDEIGAEQYDYVKSTLALVASEWERTSGVNFVHLDQDDRPFSPPHFSVLPNPDPFGEDIVVAEPQCESSTVAYFGLISFGSGGVLGQINFQPEDWNDSGLEPDNTFLRRTLQVNSSLLGGSSALFTTLRHEIGHILGFAHEEAAVQGDDCFSPDSRPLTPVDSLSVMATPACASLSDADFLSPRDQLSAYLLHNTARARFETRGPGIGYRYASGAGAQILWHGRGASEGVLWVPMDGDAGLNDFLPQPFAYHPVGNPPPAGWYPDENEVVIPLQLSGDPNQFDLLMHGPGPDANDFVVLNAGGAAVTTQAWTDDEFSVPVVGRFNSNALDRDVVYLYRPGVDDDAALHVDNGNVVVTTDVPQSRDFAYPLAAPFRGPGELDDILWFDPQNLRITGWVMGPGIVNRIGTQVLDLPDFGLGVGDYTPAVGDFNGDGKADVMLHGVSHAPSSHDDIVDLLMLSQSTVSTLIFDAVPKAIGRGYRPFVGDFDGDGIDDIFWHRSWNMTSKGPSPDTTGPNFIWYFDAAGGHEARAMVTEGDYTPYVGDFDGDGCHDIAWFDSPNDVIHLWTCMPAVRDFNCGGEWTTPADMAPVGVHWGF